MGAWKDQEAIASWGGMRGIALRWIGLILAALTYVMMLITPGTGYTIGDPGATTAYAKPLIVRGGHRIPPHLHKEISPGVDPDFVTGWIQGTQL